MAKIIPFSKNSATPLAENDVTVTVRSPLQRHLDRYQWHFGRDAYWFFATEKSRLPNKEEAQGMATLLGHSIKASDGKYYGNSIRFPKSKVPKKTVSFHNALELLICARSQLASLDVEHLTEADEKLMDQNKDICEHIATQIKLLKQNISSVRGRKEDDTFGTSRRTTPTDKGICSLK